MSHDADVLNRLIARLRDASAGYRKAGADGPGLSDVFAGAADAHDRTAESLAAEVRATDEVAPVAPDLGAEPSRLPHAVVQGPRAVVEAVEAVEAELLEAFRTAMDDLQVSGSVRDAVVRAFAGVKTGRDSALQRLDALEG